MSKISEAGRIILDQEAVTALEEMLNALKGTEAFLRISSSKLVCWIIKRYSKSNFETDKERIIQQHFNSKEYLKGVLNSGKSGEELTLALQFALQRVNTERTKRKGRKPKALANEASDSQTAPAEPTDLNIHSDT